MSGSSGQGILVVLHFGFVEKEECVKELTILPIDPVCLGHGYVILVEGVDGLVRFRHGQDGAGVIE